MPQRSEAQVSWLCLLVLMPTQLAISSENQTRGGGSQECPTGAPSHGAYDQC